jgi:hypothetical protein
MSAISQHAATRSHPVSFVRQQTMTQSNSWAQLASLAADALEQAAGWYISQSPADQIRRPTLATHLATALHLGKHLFLQLGHAYALIRATSSQHTTLHIIIDQRHRLPSV